MTDKYKIADDGKPYFLTLTVVGWIDVFIRKNHKLLIVDALKHCQKEKGLTLFAYCIMSSHIHLIARADSKYTLSDILRDFKKFTSKALVQQIIQEPESRREWMLEYFSKSGEHLKGIKNYKFWQGGSHAKEICTVPFFDQKLQYIHNNPVEDLIVEKPEDYLFSSARNYAGLDNYLEVLIETQEAITYIKK